MTEADRLAVLKVRMRLVGVHPTWVEFAERCYWPSLNELEKLVEALESNSSSIMMETLKRERLPRSLRP